MHLFVELFKTFKNSEIRLFTDRLKFAVELLRRVFCVLVRSICAAVLCCRPTTTCRYEWMKE